MNEFVGKKFQKQVLFPQIFKNINAWKTLASKLNFYFKILILLEPDYVNPWYFELGLLEF